ncbi:MAG: serine protease [Bauldia sp.]|uniref:S1C family serine protease n=1 Tax=Bauldia sp. TaxID=2575872 RepID=UPI001E12D66D|nr:S1C family serine protease [Bauldia sp.]MCB1496323.1 serine protease [Bauldia sp.]
MPTQINPQIPDSMQPRAGDYDYDLDRAMQAVVGVTAVVPDDAFTADILGTQRSGSGVLIRNDGIVLTIGYLVTEAETVWIGLSDGRTVPGHVLGYDQTTGFGLVQALARVDLPAIGIGQSASLRLGDDVVLAAAGGRSGAIAARIIGKQEFAGYWEYVLDEAIFTAPAHPSWGGAALIGPAGDLVGIGSLRLEQSSEGADEHLNMVVPIDLLEPILDDLLTVGRPNRPPRPWLGIYAVEVDDNVVVAGTASGAPADAAGLKNGDIILAVDGAEVTDLAGFFRNIWALGAAGTEVPLTVFQEGRTADIRVTSGDRSDFLKSPSMH